MNLIDPQTYYKNLPKKTVATAVLLFNAKKEFLILKTSYRKYWTLPGGVVEKDESIVTALIREVEEETNLKIKNIKLAALDYCAPKLVRGVKNSESVQVLFTADFENQKLKIDGREIIDYKFCDLSEALTLLGMPLRRLLKSYVKLSAPAYLENGKILSSLGNND